ncbi:MAG: Mpv17/PMP22 family protein [Aminipila sp.]
MKKGDFIWIAVLSCVVIFLVTPQTHQIFLSASANHPYGMAFLKFGVLASMGELLAIRIVSANWKKPKGFLWRVLIWGILGMGISLMFVLFDAGVHGAMGKGYLPSFSGNGFFSSIVTAFLISASMNLVFGPTFMGFHRITDTWIELGNGELSEMRRQKLSDVLDVADLKGFVSFVVCKTIPLFWIPAHTITFLLPPEYRVLAAAMLSICLGVILGFSKRKGQKIT